MLHFGIELEKALLERLAIFNNGTESCTIYAAQERLELYGKSLHKFKSEWERALRIKSWNFQEIEEWAKYLLKKGINLEFKNGPIEQKDLMINSLNRGNVIICDIRIPSTLVPDSECKHAILIVKLENNKLLIHDPLSSNLDMQFTSDSYKYKENEWGTNLEIDCNYFFDKEINYMKPLPNPSRSDLGYSFIVFSRN
jgi:hypothetical protein